MRILVIEDDPETASYLARGLIEAGHVVDQAHNGRDGLFLASSERYDALIVDRMLPMMDGLNVISVLRATGNATPALVLSALSAVDDRVRGLRAGGDDYLVKPFAFEELLARVEAICRRKSQPAVTTLRVGPLELNLLTRRAVRKGRELDLKPQEFRLLEFLMRRAGHVVTRTMILEAVWDYQSDPHTNVIDVHISRLRAKVDCEGAPMIHTVRGAGYSLRAPD